MNNLTLANLNKHYGKKKHALCDFSFEFTNGIYGLLGPNGAGKSTLMNIITDNLLPDKDGGKILWNGEETRILKEKFRSRLGFMPQQQNLYENMTARTFLNYISALKCLDKKQSEQEISEIMERVELTESLDKKMGGFSGGMKQRVLIASALLGNPDLIIFDEPTAGLDPKQRVIIRNMVSDLGKDKIIIISTHIVSDIESIAKEILFIKEGHLIDSGIIPELVEKVENGEKSLENLYMQYYSEVQK
ncbi:MAG: ABC transporter ATP-binding protein [Lachnospiraceae bacterium]|nr:ABC transporter ATP-binding protein [Lachnospiraceae bacterium]MCM1231483.1 ABC transporter ATP-binding protein [Ruminococcus flavefaciens]